MTARSRVRMMPDTTGNVVADDLVEIERRLGLIDQRRDVANYDRLMQIDKLAVLPQAVKKLAEYVPASRLTFQRSKSSALR